MKNKWIMSIVATCFMWASYAMQTNERAIGYAPWREDYDKKVSRQPIKTDDECLYTSECVFCSKSKLDDTQAHIIYRGDYNYVMLNTQPYTAGTHVLVVPYVHEKHIADLPLKTYAEAQTITQHLCRLLSPESYTIDIFYNIGAHASASIPDHCHQHIVCNPIKPQTNLLDAMRIVPQPYNPTARCVYLKELLTKPVTVKTGDIHRRSTCHYCCLIDSHHDEDNLVIHRGRSLMAFFNHQPFSAGHVTLISNLHHTSITTAPEGLLRELCEITVKLYPLLLSLLDMSDINIGMVSWEQKARAKNKQHLQMHLIPRKAPAIAAISNTHYIFSDMKKLYDTLVREWKKIAYKAKL